MKCTQTWVKNGTRCGEGGGIGLAWCYRKHKTATALHTDNLSQGFNVDCCNTINTNIKRDLITFSHLTINESHKWPKIQILVNDFEGKQIVVGTQM
jgi:hypothetical protein